MTEPRRRVYELLLSAGEPVKAYDLMDRYGASGVAAKPPTVYRALDFLQRKGVAHRIASTNAYVACSVEAGEHLAAFLICDCCGETIEISAPASPIQAEARAHAFQLQQVAIEARGHCVRCQTQPI